MPLVRENLACGLYIPSWPATTKNHTTRDIANRAHNSEQVFALGAAFETELEQPQEHFCVQHEFQDKAPCRKKVGGANTIDSFVVRVNSWASAAMSRLCTLKGRYASAYATHLQWRCACHCAMCGCGSVRACVRPCDIVACIAFGIWQCF